MFCVAPEQAVSVVLTGADWAVEPQQRDVLVLGAVKAKMVGSTCAASCGLVVGVYQLVGAREARLLVDGGAAVTVRARLLVFAPRPGAVMAAVVVSVASDTVRLSNGVCQDIWVKTKHWGESRFAVDQSGVEGLLYETRARGFWILKGDRVRVRVVETLLAADGRIRVDCSFAGACLGPLSWYLDRDWSDAT
jgi:DNA-directed RNA polymerase subunit E'/Rpb7